MAYRRLTLISFVLLLISAVVIGAEQDAAQTATPKSGGSGSVQVPDGGMPRYVVPETPEKRKERIGLEEDPGIDPDPNRVWHRYGTNYTIHKFDKEWVKYTDRVGWVRPHPNVNFTEELYQENEKWVWVWIAENAPQRTPDERREALKYKKYPADTIDYLTRIRPAFEPLEPPVSEKVIRFSDASSGLPTEGSFRNSLDVADMNGDGHLDLLVPSERGSTSGTPRVFLGNGKGEWRPWEGVRWPGSFNYGSAVAGDFNKDKKMDVAFGIHLKGVAILLGDGAGAFRLVLNEENFATRRIIAADVDGDGWQDIVALYEGPSARVRGKDLRAPKFTNLRAYLNRDKGQKWEGVNLAGPKEGISGDWLAGGDLNGDGQVDFVGSSLYFGATHTHYLSTGTAGKHEPYFDISGVIVPARGTYHALTTGRFTSDKRDDSIVSSIRRWADSLDPEVIPTPPLSEVVALERFAYENGALVRTPIARYSGSAPIRGVSKGDFDGDGSLDIVFTKDGPREAVILLGDGRGGFSRAKLEGIELPKERNYDVKVADVNRDKRPDLILMYESEAGTAFSAKTGRIQVLLNQGVVPGKVAK